jgi:uncharacterized protein (DUF2147 family)
MRRSQCCGPRMSDKGSLRAPAGVRALRLGLAIMLAAGLVAAETAPVAAAAPAANAATDALLGRWLTEPRDGIIEITRGADGTYQGQIIGGNAPHRLDEHNPDPGRRQQLLLGQVILKDMHPDGEGGLTGGTIYDPDSGRTYRCHIQPLAADRLKVRGFIGISLLGRTQVWTRFTGASLDLSPAGH